MFIWTLSTNFSKHAHDIDASQLLKGAWETVLKSQHISSKRLQRKSTETKLS